jgi:hypothetical protein
MVFCGGEGKRDSVMRERERQTESERERETEIDRLIDR